MCSNRDRRLYGVIILVQHISQLTLFFTLTLNISKFMSILSENELLDIRFILSHNQRADIFTKALPVQSFESLIHNLNLF